MSKQSCLRAIAWACFVLSVFLLSLTLAVPISTRGAMQRTILTTTSTPEGVDLAPDITWVDDCNIQGKRISLRTHNLLSDPVTITTTMRTGQYDIVVPPFSGSYSDPYYMYCNGHQCIQLHVDLTVDYYNQVAETNENNNYEMVSVGYAPTYCPQPTSTSTTSPTPTSTTTFSPTYTPTYAATGTQATNIPTETRTSDTRTPPRPTATTSLICFARATAGDTSCSDPQTGTYTYTVALYAACNECGFSYISLYYTPTLMIAPDIGGPFVPYAQGQMEVVGTNCILNTTATGAITVGTVPPPNMVYKVRIDYRSSSHDQGSSETAPQPICSQIATTPTLTPTSTWPPTPYTQTATPTYNLTSTRPPPSDTPTPTLMPSATSTACTLSFSDVPQGSTFYPYVICLACREIVSGYADGTFRPGENVTRGQLSKIVANAAAFNEAIAGQTFADVSPSHTFYAYIERLVLHNVINGYPCGGDGEPCVLPLNRPYFRPGNSTTRGQLAKITCRAYGCIGDVSSQTFEDVPSGNAFYGDIERLHMLGAITGYPCGGPGEPCVAPANRPYFRPGNAVTRGQGSKIVSSVFFPGCSLR